MTGQTERIITAVEQAIDKKAWDSGQMTTDRLTQMLDNFRQEILNEVRTIGAENNVARASTSHHGRSDRQETGGCTFTYSGKMWDVPKDFVFPKKVTMRQGIRFWFCGYSVDNTTYVKPFRLIDSRRLPTAALKNVYNLEWKNIFDILENSRLNLPSRAHRIIPQATIDSVCDNFLAYLKQSMYGYCFRIAKEPDKTWTTGTWGLRTRHSEVRKRGNAVEVARLPAATRRNNENGRAGNRKRKVNDNVRYPVRQQRRINRSNTNTN